MYTIVASETKLSSFLTALFGKAGEEVVRLSSFAKKEQITLKSETDGYFIVYPQSISYEQAKEKRIELLILDLEEEMSPDFWDMLHGQNGIVLCIYQGLVDKEKEEALFAKYEALLNQSLKDKSTLLVKITANLKESEKDFIIHTENKTCEFDFSKTNKIHMFDVEMIEDLLEDIGLWCERKGMNTEEKEFWVF
ncbi:MAG: hypothetical protein ACI4F9_00380 [Lachnospiraceae bacterium]